MPDDDAQRSAKELFAPDEPITNMRDRITVWALNMFYEHGFHAVGLDRIINEVGVTKTTFYNHFESKDELIVAALEMRARWESKSFPQLVDSLSDGTPRGTILARFDAMDQWFTGEQYKGCLFITACAEFPMQHDPVHRAAAGYYQHVGADFVDLCKRAGAADPVNLGRQLELLFEGAIVMRLINSDDDTAKTARLIADRLLADACSDGA